MKIYISADIEGVAGIANWEEGKKSSGSYPYFAEQMTKEVAAACQGAYAGGAREILVKDAHGSGRNMNPLKLPKYIRLIRGWSGHPYKMIQGIDKSFDALAFVGYHSSGGSGDNPLSHTISSAKIDYMKINGQYLSEFLLHSYLATYLKIPVVFLSGDEGLCNEAEALDKNIVRVATSKGIGGSSISIHPERAIKRIREGMEKALSRGFKSHKIELPGKFELEISYNYHGDAYRNSFYPGAKLHTPKSIFFETNDYFEIMRITSFTI